jgi:glycyl-tRNA synthetase
MVVEFTSLQGSMGREYALLSGEEEEVAQAIFEHYLPRFAGDDLPRTLPGIAVGLADRLDSLCGLFAAGLIPKGSADPWALRRAALSLVQILIGKRLEIDLRKALEEVRNLLPIPAEDNVLKEVLKFIEGRLRVLLLEEGFRYDVVDACLAERGYNPYLAYKSVFEFSRWVERDDWMEILWAYSRSFRIVRDFKETFHLDPSKFIEQATERLYEAYSACRVEPSSSVNELLVSLSSLVNPINTFFDEVLVMTEEREIRENRIALLQRIASLTEGIVDLTKMEGF